MRSTTFKTVRWIAGFTLSCVVTLSACSSSGNTSGGSGNPGSSSNGAASSTTITLGLLTSLTGPLSSEFGQPTVAAAQARIDLANHTNEVPGVNLKLVVQDDQSSPAGALAATQVLVNQDHVFALIDASALFAAAYKYTVQNNVPVLGWGDSTEFSDPGNRNLFAYFGSPASNHPPIKNVGLFLQSQGATKVCRLATADVPAATEGADQFASSAKAAGLPVVYSVDVPSTTTDMSAYALAMKNAGCDSAVIILPANQDTAMFQDMANLSFRLKATFGPPYGESALDKSVVGAEEGLDFFSQFQPYWMNTPAANRVRAAMKTYANVDTEAPVVGFHWGWIPTDLAIFGLKLPGASGSQSVFISDLRKVNDYDAGGFICPVDFTKSDYVPAGEYSTCGYMSQVVNGHFTAPPKAAEPIHLTNLTTYPGLRSAELATTCRGDLQL
jgi:branched-chain amino acid transport system substrate-binding protein